MSRVADIDRYLRAYFAAEQMPVAADVDAPVLPFVTLSRQAGVGGHELADSIVDVFAAQADEELFGGWRVYDRTLCEMVGADPRYAASLDSLVREEYRSKGSDFFHQMVRSTVDQKQVMDRVFLAVRTVARMGKAVIVGRAGSHVTRDMPQGVSLRVVAPEEMRIRRAMKTHGFTEREARIKGTRRDADRVRLLKEHFGADIDAPTGYDATFNSGLMTFVEIAHSVAAIVRLRADRNQVTKGGRPRKGSSSVIS
jgi:cytidylate kinase